MTDFRLPCPATGKLSKTTVFLNLFVLPLFPKLSLNSVLGVTLEWQGPETLSAHSRVGDEAFPGKGPGPLTGPKQNWAASVAGLMLSQSFRSKPAWDSAVSWTPPHSRFFPPPPPVLWSHYFSERRLRLADTAAERSRVWLRWPRPCCRVTVTENRARLCCSATATTTYTIPLLSLSPSVAVTDSAIGETLV